MGTWWLRRGDTSSKGCPSLSRRPLRAELLPWQGPVFLVTATARRRAPLPRAAGSAWARVSQVAGCHRGTPSLASCPPGAVSRPESPRQSCRVPGGGFVLLLHGRWVDGSALLGWKGGS